MSLHCITIVATFELVGPCRAKICRDDAMHSLPCSNAAGSAFEQGTFELLTKLTMVLACYVSLYIQYLNFRMY